MKWWYYFKNYVKNALPSFYFKWNYYRLINNAQQFDLQEIEERLNYYCKINTNFILPKEISSISSFKKTNGTGYYLDLKEFLHYLQSNTRIAYYFGDELHINVYPTLFKARPLIGNNQNSVLFKLNKKRHFYFVNDSLSFDQKIDKMVWRGGAYQENRKRFVELFWNHPMFEIGQTNKPIQDVPWQKKYMSVKEQLQYKFIYCGEGNDVATNLKWAMSSNSLVFMPQPSCETWFMEGVLIPNVHYVEIKADFSDVLDKMNFYIQNPNLAQKIIHNAHQHVNRFKNQDLEDYLCIKVLEKYLELSSQKDVIKF
jgi:hypothetical protein